MLDVIIEFGLVSQQELFLFSALFDGERYERRS